MTDTKIVERAETMPLSKESSLLLKEDEVVVEVDNVSKKFSGSIKRSMLYGLKDVTRNVFKMHSKPEKLRKGEFWAVKDISFELRKGECLGIIGPNGAGKTTLLSMLNGVFMPDKGKITIKGKTTALITVGAGFHPMLTGRENIYINGAILGMSKTEIDNKFDAIVEFAEIGEFLDMPVKNYSTGMFMRLGFSIAVHCEPNILLVDEILSVGDLKFRHKCAERMKQLLSKTSIIFVSHNLRQVSTICDKVILLNKGSLVCEGPPNEVIAEYMNQIVNLEVPETDIIVSTAIDSIKRFSAYLTTENGKKTKELEFGKSFYLNMSIESDKTFRDVYAVISILTQDGITATIITNEGTNFTEIKTGKNLIKCLIEDPRLNPNIYTMTIRLKIKLGPGLLKANLGYFRVEHSKETNKEIHKGVYKEKAKWKVK